MSNIPSALNSDQLSEIGFLNGLDLTGALAYRSFQDWNGQDPAGYNPSLGSAHKWGGGTAGTTGGTVIYAFDPGSNWSTAEQATLKGAMALWSDEANITFVQASSPAQASLAFYRYGTTDAPVALQSGTYTVDSNPTGTPGSAFIPAIRSAYITIDTSLAGWNEIGSITAQGGYGPATVVHELGHVLGLGHAGPYDGIVDPATQQLSAYDTQLWSTMSYIAPNDPTAAYAGSYPVQGASWGSSDGIARSSETPMPLDIAAAQQLYGPATGGALTGGQTFGFNCNITDASRMFFDFTQNTAPVVTLYDSGLYNTLDLSGFSQNATVNLNPGMFSSCGGLVNNVGIAYGTAVNNVVGGAGNDWFTTNANGDSINGGGGNNVVELRGTEAQYAYSGSAGGSIVVTPDASGIGGTDTLTNVQAIYFDGSGAKVSTAALPLTVSAPAVPNFTYVDTTAGAPGSAQGDRYSGGVSYLKWQYLWAGQDGVNITAKVPDVFIRGGPGTDALAASGGSNVLDGGTGSNFLVGAPGTDGGTDTFFVDGRGGAVTWSTAVDFHHGDAVTLWGFTSGQSTYAWAANDGAAGFQGATIHAQTAGAGTATNASLTFAGMSFADAGSKLAISAGSAGGAHYLYVAYVG